MHCLQATWILKNIKRHVSSLLRCCEAQNEPASIAAIFFVHIKHLSEGLGSDGADGMTVKARLLTYIEGWMLKVGWMGLQEFKSRAHFSAAMRGHLRSNSKKKMSRLKKIIVRERADKAVAMASQAASQAAATSASAKQAHADLTRDMQVRLTQTPPPPPPPPPRGGAAPAGQAVGRTTPASYALSPFADQKNAHRGGMSA